MKKSKVHNKTKKEKPAQILLKNVQYTTCIKILKINFSTGIVCPFWTFFTVIFFIIGT